jgi:uncharacterized UPF0160 family protein
MLNSQKSNFMVMEQSRDNIDLHVRISDQIIKRVKSTKLLGVIIDQSLPFEEHINEICNKANTRLSFMSRLRHYVPKDSQISV